jgi:hypothetical protein
MMRGFDCGFYFIQQGMCFRPDCDLPKDPDDSSGNQRSLVRMVQNR